MSLVAEPSTLSRPRAREGPLAPSVRDGVLLTAFCGALFFYGLNVGELYRNECLRAILAAEFLRTGNWVVPTLYGEPLLTKPPGMYAAIALASWPAGDVREWTARLPSALAATLLVLLFAWSFRRQLGRPAGLVAALTLPCSVLWLDKASSAEIDMLQVFWVAASVLFFLRGLEDAEQEATPRSVWPWWQLALLCVAGGFLTKWTAPVFFYGTVLPLLWWRGRLRLLFGRAHLVSAAVAGGMCLAWVGAAVALAGWDVFYATVSKEALMRLAPNHHPKPYPWGETLTHPLRLLAGGLPAALFALPAFRPGFADLWDDRGRRLLQALHCWLWPGLLFWSLVPEHALRHSFPLQPALAGLAAFVWVAWLTGRLPWRFMRLSPAGALMLMLVLWLGGKVFFVEYVTPARGQGREPCAKGQLLAAHVPDGRVLYLFRLKDEGIMFYYGRTVRRLTDPAQLPSSSEPLYCILTQSEWTHWNLARPAKPVLHLRDEQGDPIVLVRVWNSPPRTALGPGVMNPPTLPDGVKVLSISELTQSVKTLLEEGFPQVWVTGEVSNLARPSSGHLYLTLKDAKAQLRAVIWRGVALRMKFDLRDGMEVIAGGRINVYAPRGEYQLSIEQIQPKGIGELELALRQLREKLFRLGYFAPERKKPLPTFPRRLALVTSPTGAAVRDMLEILGRRWPLTEVVVCPVKVQGEGSAQEIAAGIERLNRLHAAGRLRVDAMIVGRGGGTLEDLWAFNEEIVARAIYASRIPVISGVGHEVDLTIADLVADCRALTPSEAAERAVPDLGEQVEFLDGCRDRLRNLLAYRITSARQRLDALAARRVFRAPRDRFRDQERRVDDWAERLQRAAKQRLQRARDQVQVQAARLETLSPLNVLARGYSLTRTESDERVVRSPEQVRPGDRLVTDVQHGRIVSRVEELRAAPAISVRAQG